jgi:molybdopterin synthase sulfur carrier subunit
MIRILLFGATADAAGSREFDINIDGDASVEAILESLKMDHPPLSRLRLITAVNEEYADVTTMLNDGDELAIFTAVSGG